MRPQSLGERYRVLYAAGGWLVVSLVVVGAMILVFGEFADRGPLTIIGVLVIGGALVTGAFMARLGSVAPPPPAMHRVAEYLGLN